MAIKKENDGTYMVDVSFGTHNGKRIRKRKKGIKTKKEAQEIEAKMRNNDTFENKIINYKFNEIYLKYINDCKIEIEKGNMRKSTLDSKICIFEKHIVPYFKNYFINKIYKTDILNFQQKISQKKNLRNSKQNLSIGTLRKIYKQLNAFFEYCLQEEFIYSNPCRKVNNFKNEKQEKEFLTLDEFSKLINIIENTRDKTILHLLFFSGIRISELLGLKLDTIILNVDNPYIKICNTYHKGEIREYAKTEDSKDIVFIDENTKNVLIEYINSKDFKDYNSNYLFPSLDSKSGILSEKAVGNMIKKYCVIANIDKKITCHTFRHSHVAMLIDMGLTLEDIKNRVRHASIKTTSDEYGHMYDSRKKEIANSIANYVQNHSKNSILE